MALIRIGALDDLQEGSAMHVEFDNGARAVAICNIGGRLHALDGICPHSGGPLGHGVLNGTTLACPYHAWEFDCVTGASDMNEDLKQTIYPVKVEGGEIWVELP